MKTRCGLAFFFLALSFPFISISAQYPAIFDSPGAAEQLRLGVQSYHHGRFAESILLFEKSLAYAPGEPLIQYWLGRAYHKNGFEETALRAWQPLLASGNAPPHVGAKAELIRASRSLAPIAPEYRYVEVARFEGRKGNQLFFQRPSTAIPMRDGSFFLVSHGSNEILSIDTSGSIRDRKRGGLIGLDRPFGAATLADGTLFVTEFNGNRIARVATDGTVKLIGERGRGPGALLGPEYIAVDGAGYIFVNDYGNARISKYDDGGNFVLSFGAKTVDAGFPGLASPAGIAVRDGVVYVADSLRKSIFRFDASGNYLGVLAEGQLHFAEGLSLWDGGKALLVADTDRVVSLDFETETLREVYHSPDRRARIVGAVQDCNGNLLLCDFDASAISILSEVSLLATGYDVEIERIISDAFPKVEVELSVRDRNGSPIVGLRQGNFYLTERLRSISQSDEGGKTVIRTEETLKPVPDAQLIGEGEIATGIRATLLLERSATMMALKESVKSSLTEIYRVLGQDRGILSLVTAGTSPARETQGDLASALRIASVLPQGRGRFDLGLRLAATSLLPAEPRDAVVYLGTGAVDEASFQGTSLSELSSLLRNNDIRFYAVVLGTPSASLLYLAERTRGAVYFASRPRGLKDLAIDFRSSSSGKYRLSYTSRADPVFGRAYNSVAVEAYLFKKSGKDELGFYAPLQ